MTADANPPVAPVRRYATVLHGETRIDDYGWLRDKESPEVRAYLEAENAHTVAAMAPLQPLEARLYGEFLGRIKETDESVPYQEGNWLYWSRTEEGKQYATYCRRRDEAGTPHEVILDVNELAEGKPFMSVGAMSVSDDGRYLAFTTDETGFREYTLQVKDLESGSLLPDRVELVDSIAWAADNRTLLYAVEDHAKRPHQAWSRRLGEPDATLILEEADEMFRVHCWRSRSRRFLFLGVASHTATEIRFLPADSPDAPPVLVSGRRKDHEYAVDDRGDWLYIRTNDRGRNFRVVRTPVEHPGEGAWEEVIEHRVGVMVERVECFSRHVVVSGREGGLPMVEVGDGDGGAWPRIQFHEPVFEAHTGPNRAFDTTVLRYQYQSPVTPPSTYDFDLDAGTHTLLKRQEVPGGYDPAAYAVERLHATAADGTRIPVTVVRPRVFARNGEAPCHLTGYGAYGYPYPVGFSVAHASLLDRGAIVAIAHIRGGGEMGKPWHDAGRMAAKMNTFTDFIAVADMLAGEGWCSRERLVISGGSAGGLLMGAVLNLRPDVAKAVVLLVPFVDVVNTMLDETLPLTVGEWEEWGNPHVEEQYAWIRAYCPYSNLAARDYPAMLVRTSLNDSQVMYWEPAKYVAKLRTLWTDARPLLLETNMAAGHGGASGRYDHLKEQAFDYAFMLWQMGLAEGD